jgi:putative copper export protein
MPGETIALTYLALAKWISYVGFFMLTGTCAARLIIVSLTVRRVSLNQIETGLIEKWLRNLALGSVAIVLLAVLARLLAQSYASFGIEEPVTLELIRIVGFESRWGGRWWPQVIAAGLALVAVVCVCVRKKFGWWVVFVAVGCLATTLPLTGHAMASGDVALIAWALQSVHGLAAGLWLGTLAAVLVLARGLRVSRCLDRDRVIAELVHTFSPLAVTAVLAVLLTGALTAVLYLENVRQLWETAYGRTLLIKVSLVLTTGAVGVYNWLRLRPRLGEARGTAVLFYSGGAELFLALVLLGVTAVLVHLPPSG